MGPVCLRMTLSEIVLPLLSCIVKIHLKTTKIVGTLGHRVWIKVGNKIINSLNIFNSTEPQSFFLVDTCTEEGLFQIFFFFSLLILFQRQKVMH